MKIAISVPDVVFDAAERLARRLGKSRSQLYSEAVAEYVRDHQSDAVTEQLDSIYAEESSDIPPEWERIELESLSDEDW